VIEPLNVNEFEIDTTDGSVSIEINNVGLTESNGPDRIKTLTVAVFPAEIL
jgi:hypothetical protein